MGYFIYKNIKMGGALLENEVKEYIAKSGKSYNVFVETGTCEGYTVIPLSKLFTRCYTIELSERFYNISKNRSSDAGVTNIEFVLGDSETQLPLICQKETEGIVFFLDAHYSSGNTAQGVKDVPLFEELQAIGNRNQQDIIIIDDYRLFGKKGNEDWSEINTEKLLNTLQNRVHSHFVNNDRLVIYLN